MYLCIGLGKVPHHRKCRMLGNLAALANHCKVEKVDKTLAFTGQGSKFLKPV